MDHKGKASKAQKLQTNIKLVNHQTLNIDEKGVDRETEEGQ